MRLLLDLSSFQSIYVHFMYELESILLKYTDDDEFVSSVMEELFLQDAIYDMVAFGIYHLAIQDKPNYNNALIYIFSKYILEDIDNYFEDTIDYIKEDIMNIKLDKYGVEELEDRFIEFIERYKYSIREYSGLIFNRTHGNLIIFEGIY